MTEHSRLFVKSGGMQLLIGPDNACMSHGTLLLDSLDVVIPKSQ